MRRLLLPFSILLFSWWLPASAQALLPPAAAPYVIDESFPGSAVLGRHLDLYEDRGGELTAPEVIEMARAGAFSRSTRDELGFGTTASAWWALLTLENRGAEAKQLVLEQRYGLIDQFDLWQLVDGELQVRHSGDSLPFSQREVATNSLNFLLELPPNSTKTLLLRYRSNGSVSINLTLHGAIPFAEQLGRSQALQGIFYGALIALALYNLFIFLIVRDRSYLLYITYLVVFALFISGFNGHSTQYLWPESTWWANHSLLIFWGGVIAMALIFSQNFLNLKIYSPRINRVANGFSSIALGCAVASLFMPYAMVVKVLFILAPPSYALILYAAYKGIRRGFAPAIYFMVAWTLLMVAAITSTLISAGVIKQMSSLSPLIVQWGALFEMVLLSIALASRIRNLEQDSLTDSLTHLFNRRFFDAQLERSLAQAQRSGRPLSLMVLDIDHFKSFNDTLGHGKGDQALKQVGQVLSQVVRESDYACRYGGEEFAVIMPDTDRAEAVAVAERVRGSFMAHEVAGTTLTASIGIASVSGEESAGGMELFGRADASLYRAKEQGRNRVVCDSDARE